MPALDTGEGWILTQAGAVLHYLARRFPQAALGSDGSLRDQAELDRWSHFLTGDLHPAFFPLFAPQRYTVSEDKSALDAVRTAAQALIQKKLALLEAHLAGKAHVVGGRRTFIDAYALPMLRWGRAMLPGGLEGFQSCAGLLERLEADPATKKVLADEGL